MAFKVSAQGVAQRIRYVMSPKKLADPGKVIRGFELLQKMAGHANVSLGGLDEKYKVAVNVLASATIARLLFEELQWFSRNGARIVITYSKSGVWGGILRQPKFRNDSIALGGGGDEISARRFVNMLEQMKINQWGYIRGLLYPMSGYSTHCTTYGTKSNAVFLWIKIHDG